MQGATRTQSKEPFNLIIDGSAANTAIAAQAVAIALPLTTDGFIDLRGVDQPTLRVMFGGTTTADDTLNYAIDLWYLVNGADGVAYVPVVIATGIVTLGALAYAAGTNLGAAGNLFADTITVSQSNSGGVSVHSLVLAGSIAMLEIDLQNAIGVQIRTDLGTGDTADVFAQLGEASSAGAADAGAVLRDVYQAGVIPALGTNENA